MKIYSVNPSTEKVLASYTLLSKKEVEKKLANSVRAFSSWKEQSVEKRTNYLKNLGALLRKRQQELAQAMTLEMGKPIKEARAEIEKCAWVCEYYAEKAKTFLAEELISTELKKGSVQFQPLGVILGVMPWNFPFWQAFRFAIPALAAGNVVMVKHASNVPTCALALENVFAQAGFKGVFQTLLIDSKQALALISDERIAGVSLTGSLGAGKSIGAAAGAAVKPCVLELGGSDAFIILDDANLTSACETALKARLVNNGQSCIAAKRFIVVQTKVDEFEKQLKEKVAALRTGDPLKESNEVGPLARKDLRDILISQVQDAKRKGAKVLFGGNKIDGKGFYFQPAVVSNVRKNMKLYTEEAFGPVFSIITVKDESEAIAVANATSYGLGASIWSQNQARAENVARQIEAGMVFINGMVKSDPRFPFGGVKQSGIGRELGSYGIKSFVNIKTVITEH